jgi:hypothetical protein
MVRMLLTQTRGNRLQCYVLIALGIIFLLGTLLHLNPFIYPIGLLLFGIGIFVAALFNPYRLLISGILLTLIGAAIFFTYKPVIPDGGSTLFFAVALGLFGIALAARRGYVGKGPITPALLVFLVALIEYPPTFHLFPASIVPFVLSLWFPGVGLLVLGVVYLFVSSKR